MKNKWIIISVAIIWLVSCSVFARSTYNPNSPMLSSVRAGTFSGVGFFNHYLAIDPRNRMHLTFLADEGEFFYGNCQVNCATEAAWKPIKLLSKQELGVAHFQPEGLGADSKGGIHMLLSAASHKASRDLILYGTCISDCSSPPNWTWLDLSSLIPFGVIGYFSNNTRPFMVEPNGRVSFLSDTGTYFACNSNCTSLANWSFGNALTGTPLQAMVDSAGITHVMLAQLGFSGINEALLRYARCASNCRTPSSWQVSPLGFVTNGPLYAASLAVTPNGRVFMSYNQGGNTNLVHESRRLIVRSCAGSNCLDLNSFGYHSPRVS